MCKPACLYAHVYIEAGLFKNKQKIITCLIKNNSFWQVSLLLLFFHCFDGWVITKICVFFLNHRFLIFCVSLNIRNISWSYSCVERVLWNINYSLISVHVWYSRHTDEGRVAAIEEGAVEHLQDEGEVLKRQVWGGGTNGKQQALQGRQEERKHRRPQVHLLLALPYKHNNDWSVHVALYESGASLRVSLQMRLKIKVDKSLYTVCKFPFFSPIISLK